MGKIEKSAGSVSIIGGSDGPTSVFVAGKRRKTLKQKWQRGCFRRRKERIARKIKPGTHTMDEVVSYVKEKYGFEEIPEKDIHLYYGVTEDDIVNETRRYKELLTTLAMKRKK